MPTTTTKKTTRPSILSVVLIIVLIVIVIGLLIGFLWRPHYSSSSSTTRTTNNNHQPDKILKYLVSQDVTDPVMDRVVTVNEQFQSTFPDNEANFITKPYQSSVSQCHLTTNGIECQPILRNVRWKEPIQEVHIYDTDSPVTRPMHLYPGPPSPCMNSLQS